MNQSEQFSTLATMSQYWATPISNILMLCIALAVLYPLLKNVSMQHLNAAMEALGTVKKLPEIIQQVAQISLALRDLRSDIQALRDQTEILGEMKENISGLRRQVKDLSDLTDDQASAALEVQTSTIGEQAASNWNQIRDLWLPCRDLAESIIENIPDGRVRRKYDTIRRNTYQTIADTMRADGLLTDQQADALKSMDTIFIRHRNRRMPVTADILHNFKVNYEKFRSGLALTH